MLCASMLKSCAASGMRAWFIVHRRELVKQSIAAFDRVGVHAGVIAAGFQEDYRAPVQIASIGTLQRRWERYAPPSMIVWDESHHLAATNWMSLKSQFASSYHIGLTATPMRLDGRGLGNYFSTMVKGPSVRWLIDNKYLAPYKLYAPAGIDVTGVHSRMGDFSRDELAAAADRPSITGCAVEHYKKLCPTARACVFACSIEHSRHIVAQFEAAGIPSAHVDGETDPQMRDMILQRFSEGSIRVVSNVELFGEGFDLPSMDAVILMRPTQSLGLYLQQVGRCLRYSEGKTAYILDHAGNCARHGMPCEEREWELTTDKIKRSQSASELGSVKICPKCFAAQFSGSRTCKLCGGVFPVEARKVDEKKGDLVEVKAAQRAVRVAQGRCQTMEELVAEGRRRGMKNAHGWAYNVMQARKNKRSGK